MKKAELWQWVGLGVLLFVFGALFGAFASFRYTSVAFPQDEQEAPVRDRFVGDPASEHTSVSTGTPEFVQASRVPSARSEDVEAPAASEVLSPMVAYRKALRSGSRMDRMVTLAAAAAAAGPEEIRDLIQRFENRLLGDEDSYALAILMAAWGRMDGPAAARYAEQNLNGWQMRQASSVALESWAESKPQAALDWIYAQEEPTTHPWYAGVVRGLAEVDLTLASELFEKMEFGRERGRTATKVLGEYLKQSPSAMRRYIAGVQEDTLRTGLNRIGASLAGQTHPEASADWVLQIPLDQGGANAVQAFVAEWAGKAPEAAAKFVERIDDQAIKETALRDLVRAWARKEPQAVLAWIEQLERPSERDEGYRSLALLTVRHSPAVAMEQALKIGDDGMRLETLRGITARWIRVDPDGAREVLGDAAVDQSVRTIPTGQ